MALLIAVKNLRSRHATAALVIVLALCAGSASAVGSPSDSSSSEQGERGLPGTLGKPYTFHKDWFGAKIPQWTTLLAEYKGRPGLHYLEIGTFEGRSLIWMLDNILTHPTARAVGVDIFVDTWSDYESVLMKNLAISGASDRTRIIDGYGERVAKALPEESFDIIYLDGGHAARTLFAQAAISWQLLKEGGVLIFDDYVWRPQWPLDQRPEAVVDTFLMAYGRDLEVLYKGSDVFVRKLPPACEPQYCSVLFDQYVYDWQRAELIDPKSEQVVDLSDEDKGRVEELLRRLVDPDLRQMLSNDVLDALRTRLEEGGDSTP